jgi:hypothetical protein
MKTIVENTDCYGRGPNGELHESRELLTLQVSFILDMVPGAWHQPIDLMTHIADHSYVMDVTYGEPKTSAVTRSDDEYRDPDVNNTYDAAITLDKLKVLMGSTDNGSDQEITFSQQAKTGFYVIKTPKQNYYNASLAGVINDAYKAC